MNERIKGIDYKSLLFADRDISKLFIMLIAVFAAVVLATGGRFFNAEKIITVAYLFPELGILSLGMMLAMVTGGIDLSVVAVADLAGILSCLFMRAVMPENASLGVSIIVLMLTLLVALLVGAVCGIFTGSLIAKIGIPAMLATLGSSDVILGLAVAITNGSSVKDLPLILSDVVNERIFGFIPATTLIFIVCAVIINTIMKKKPLGFKIYMLGSNPTVSRFSGINNDRVIILTYMMSGMLSGVSGLLMCGHFNSARSDFGKAYTLQAIIVCVLAGISPNGGKGKVIGIAIAVLILQILSSCFTMFPDISDFYKNLIWGLVLLFVITMNVVSGRRAAKRRLKR